MYNILIGIIFIIGGASGQLVLRGTNSSDALIFVGIGLVIWGIIQLSSNYSQVMIDDIRPTNNVEGDENVKQISEIYSNKAIIPIAVEQKVKQILDKMISGVSNTFECDKAARTLNELQEKNLISPDEFSKRTKEIELISIRLQIEEKVESKSKPLLSILTDEKSNGVITEEEFIEKKENLIKKLQLEVEHDFLTKPKLSDIDNKIIEKLEPYHIIKLERYLSVMEIGEVIVFQNNSKIKLMDEERWGKIQEQDFNNEFQLIYKRP